MNKNNDSIELILNDCIRDQWMNDCLITYIEKTYLRLSVIKKSCNDSKV
jgi:hypothetical protein